MARDNSSARTLHPFARLNDRTGELRAYVATDDDGAVYVRSGTHGRWQVVHSGLNASADAYVTRCAGNFGWSVERYDATTGDYYPSAAACTCTYASYAKIGGGTGFDIARFDAACPEHGEPEPEPAALDLDNGATRMARELREAFTESPAEELGRLRRELSELDRATPEHRDTLDRIAVLTREAAEARA